MSLLEAIALTKVAPRAKVAKSEVTTTIGADATSDAAIIHKDVTGVHHGETHTF